MSLKKIKMFQAHFHGVGFDLHRHDSYAIGRTISGIHCFNYRGKKQYSQPGNTIALFPDELHDGSAGDENGFGYRIVYIEPSIIQEVLGGKPLPYINDGVSNDHRLFRALDFLDKPITGDLDSLEESNIIFEISSALSEVSSKRRGRVAYDYKAAEIARDMLSESLDQSISIEDLAKITGRSKWSLTRDFRALFGTSPYRYLIMRRIDKVKELLVRGEALADVALKTGFVDQSHMTNTFKQTVGISPLSWLKLTIAIV